MALNQPISKVCTNENINCAETLGCAYFYGICETFVECKFYVPQKNTDSVYACEMISKYCIWDGKSDFCQDKKFCEDMIYEECGNIEQINGDKYSCQQEENKCQQKECFSFSQTGCEIHRNDCYLGSKKGECLDNGKQCEQYSSSKCSKIIPLFGICHIFEGYCQTKECKDYPGKSIEDCQYNINKEGQNCTYTYRNPNKCSTPCRTGSEDSCIKEIQSEQIQEYNYCIQNPQFCYSHQGCVDKICFSLKNRDNCEQIQQCIYQEYVCANKNNTCINITEKDKCNNSQYCQWSNDIVRVKQQCEEILNPYLCVINQQLSGIPCIWFNTIENSGCISMNRCEQYERTYCNTTLSLEGYSCIIDKDNFCRTKKCSEYDREECIMKQQCFYTGNKCLDYSEKYCNKFQDKSYCISDLNGVPCIWNDGFPGNYKCQQFTKCSSIQLNINLTLNCSLYSQNCVYTSYKNNHQCVPQINCRKSDYNYYGDTFQKCQQYSSNCASDGIHCIPITNCEYYGEQVCQDSIDSDGDLCFWNSVSISNSNRCEKRLFSCENYHPTLCNNSQTTLEGVKCILDIKNPNSPYCRTQQCDDLPVDKCYSLELCIIGKEGNMCQKDRCKSIEQNCQLINNECIQEKEQSLCNVAYEGTCKWERGKCVILNYNSEYENELKQRVNPLKLQQGQLILIFMAASFIWNL